MKSNLANTVISPQRYLGFQYSEYTKEEGKFARCPPKNNGNTISFKVSSQGQDEFLAPEQVTAAFLNQVGSIVELNKLSNKFEVVAVPNYLTHHERKAMIYAISIAKASQKETYGFAVINESTAIGFDYGFFKMNEFPENEEEA